MKLQKRILNHCKINDTDREHLVYAQFYMGMV